MAATQQAYNQAIQELHLLQPLCLPSLSSSFPLDSIFHKRLPSEDLKKKPLVL